jgi:ribosome-interacting GTPase 1
MPANLTQDYLDAEHRLQSATDPQERLEILEEMLRVIPKHKGTDKLQADLKRKISKTRAELKKRGPAGRKRVSHHVPREGAGQIAVAGPPNAGKSSLVRAITSADPEVAPYSFTTRSPIPAMMPFEDVQVQLVDLPPVSDTYMEFWVPSIIRAADAVMLVVDLSDDGAPLVGTEETLTILQQAKIRLVGDPESPPPWAEEEKGVALKKALMVCSKCDRPEAADNLEILLEFFGDHMPHLVVSPENGSGLDPLRETLFRMLGKIRVYSKAPGKPPSMATPFTLRDGARVIDFARQVHKDFAEGLQHARVWGSGKFDGQKVPRDHVLSDRDVVELNI